MKVAIIGGGASGMTTAHLLDKSGEFEVTVFEKQGRLGGHICTINKNIKIDNFDGETHLEAGVVEFSSEFHYFLRLMKTLKVHLEPMTIGTAIFKNDGRRFMSPDMISRNSYGLKAIIDSLKLIYVMLSSIGVWLTAIAGYASNYRHRSLSDCIKEKQIHDAWLKLLTMYCYSIPYNVVGNVPAEIALPAMRNYMWSDWFRIDCGVYTYIEKILEQFNGSIRLNADINGVSRTKKGVSISLSDGQTIEFDKVIFAQPPDQVLQLLSDATEDEVTWFRSWQRNDAKTTVHSDSSLYANFDIENPSEFDFFQMKDGDWGYNAHLNQICGLSTDVDYYLSFNLNKIIAKDKVIHTQTHHTPLYTTRAIMHRDLIIKNNGKNNTYYAGAYLYDGLHEGAIKSAYMVAEQLNKFDPSQT